VKSNSKNVRYKFPKVFDDEDFKAVLTDTPQKTSKVREAVIKRHPIKYKTLSHEWTKQTLIRLEATGEISGGKDPEVGVYLWRLTGEEEKKKLEEMEE